MAKKDPIKVAAAYKGLLEKNKVLVSPSLGFIRADYEKWIRNTTLFFAPAFLLFLQQLVAGKSVQESAPILYLWLLNTLIDVTKKYLSESTYKVEPEPASANVKSVSIQAKEIKK